MNEYKEIYSVYRKQFALYGKLLYYRILWEAAIKEAQSSDREKIS